MTLNGVIAVILRNSTEIGNFGTNYVKVVEDRKCPLFAATQAWRRLGHRFTALSMTRWSRRSHSSVKPKLH